MLPYIVFLFVFFLKKVICSQSKTVSPTCSKYVSLTLSPQVCVVRHAVPLLTLLCLGCKVGRGASWRSPGAEWARGLGGLPAECPRGWTPSLASGELALVGGLVCFQIVT